MAFNGQGLLAFGKKFLCCARCIAKTLIYSKVKLIEGNGYEIHQSPSVYVACFSLLFGLDGE